MANDSDPSVEAERAEIPKTLLAATLQAAATSEAVHATSPTGSSRYQVGSEIGRGGMGAVFTANDRQFSREVAIKTLRADMQAGELFGRFLSEALISAHLEHPGVPPVFERGELDGRPFYAMRKVRGRTLEEELASATTLEERLELIPALVRVAETLSFAHSQGIVHRDVKPANLVVGTHGETYVLDWGIAKVRGTSGQSLVPSAPGAVSADNATLPGSVMGTPAYMAPEQADGRADDVDERTDVFALGAILYHILSGRFPYSGKNAVESARRAEFESLEAAAPGSPFALRSICMRAMARRPEDRYQSATEFASSLKRFAADAVAAQDCGPAKWLATGITVATGLIAVLALIAVIVLAPIGNSIPIIIADTLAVFGIVLSITHYMTHGRYRLSPLILATCGATFLVGILALALGGQELLIRMLGSQEPAAPTRSDLLQGGRQLLGAVAAAAALTLVQLFAWAWAQRRALTGAVARG